MLNYFLSLDAEFKIFIIIECILILGYFIFIRYSRSHGGVFDRRIEDRRSNTNRGTWRTIDRRMFDIGFGKIKVELAGANESYEIDTDRRLSDRRMIADRRNI